MAIILAIDDLGSGGINSDVKPWDLPANAITYGKNFRSKSRSIISVSSEELWSAPAATFNAGHLLAVGAISGDFWLVAGRTKVEVFDGATWSDISNAAGYSGIGVDQELDWTSCMIGTIPVLNNKQHYPEYWSPQNVSQPMQALEFSSGLTWDAANKSCTVMRSHKNYLFALDLVESGIELPSSYRWSHPADNNGLPFTWDETDLSAIAGKAQIGSGGRIIDGMTLRNSFVIYSESGIDSLSPSNDEFVWKRTPISSTIGLASRNCIVEVKGIHYFLGDGDIYSNDGNKVNSVMHDRIRERFTSNASPDYYDRAYAFNNVAAKEIWFCVVEGSALYPNAAYIFNWKNGSWDIRDLPENIAFGAYGYQSEPPTTYDTVEGTYDSTSLTYGSQKRTPLNTTAIGVDATTSGLVIIDPNDAPMPDGVTATLERTDISIGGLRDVHTITAIYPKMKGSEPVSIQIGSQEIAGGAVTWEDSVTFTPDTDRKVDIKSTGALHCWRVSSVGTGHFDISGLDFDGVYAGAR